MDATRHQVPATAGFAALLGALLLLPAAAAKRCRLCACSATAAALAAWPLEAVGL